MIRINLLPYRDKEKKEDVKRQVAIFAGILALLVLSLAGVQLYLSSRIATLETEIKVAEDKLIVLSKKIGDIEKYKHDKSVLERKLAVIGKLDGNRLAPVRRLDDMTRLVPARDLWLEKMTETGDTLRVEGIARTNVTVAHFMRNLESASFIKSVDLVSSKEKEISGVKLQQFILTCVMAKGA
jgi:type IV pilus assembly protein PilN